MNVTSISASSNSELETKLASHIRTQFRPTLAIVFSSPDFNYADGLHLIRSFNIELIGCTTSGEILNDEILTDSITVMLFDIAPSKFKIVPLTIERELILERNVELGCESFQIFQNPGVLLFIGGAGIDGELILSCVKKKLPEGTPIYGALAGDNLQNISPVVFGNDEIVELGMSCLVVDADYIDFYGMSYSGWNALGGDHIITKSVGNVVYEIDNQPALNVLQKYFGDMDIELYDSGGEVLKFAAIFPLQIIRGEYQIMRSVLKYDTEVRSLILAGGVEEGDTFKFCPTPSFEVIQNTINEFVEYAQTVSEPDAVVMINCKGRHVLFGPILDDEISGVYQVWKKPLGGFLSDGEIGRLKNDNNSDLHNVTCTLLLIKDKN